MRIKETGYTLSLWVRGKRPLPDQVMGLCIACECVCVRLGTVAVNM